MFYIDVSSAYLKCLINLKTVGRSCKIITRRIVRRPAMLYGG